jgi:hypothetical protein
MNALTREIGDRGRDRGQTNVGVSEGVPPTYAIARAQAQALAPASTPAPAPAPAAFPVSQAATPPRAAAAMEPAASAAISPSLQMTLAESSALVERLLEQHRAMMREQREEAKAEMEARLAEQRKALEVKDAISDAQITALQARLESLHAAQLLAEEELYALEDTVADYVELRASMLGQAITEAMVYASHSFGAASKLHKLVALSAALPADVAFARQVRRKCL